MNEELVNILEPQVLQASIERQRDVLRMMIGVPELGCDVKVLSLYNALVNSAADALSSLCFISIVASRIEATVSRFDRVVRNLLWVVEAPHAKRGGVRNLQRREVRDDFAHSVAFHFTCIHHIPKHCGVDSTLPSESISRMHDKPVVQSEDVTLQNSEEYDMYGLREGQMHT